MSLCLYPVAAAPALLWAKGELSDAGLLLTAPLTPEAIFVVNLPDRAAYPELLRLCQSWHRAGAVAIITRSSNPVIIRHLEKNGGSVTFREGTGQVRIAGGGSALSGWLRKFSRG